MTIHEPRILRHRSPVGFACGKPQHLAILPALSRNASMRPMPRSNHPVRFLGRQPYRRIPFAHLVDVEAGERLALERDLRDAPTPISGGMRKALNKELGKQNSLRYRPQRRYREPDLRRAYGLMEAVCGYCRHAMYFDEVDGDPHAIKCDRCKRPIW